MHRLKIALVLDRFGSRFGGAEAYGVALARELAQDHDITVFAREYDPACDVQLPFVPVRLWSRWPGWIRVSLFAWRARQLTRHGFDIVHSHMNGWCGDVEVVHVTPVRYNWRVRPLPFLKRALSWVSPRVHTYLSLERHRVAERPAHRTVAVSDLIAEQLREAYGHCLTCPVIAPGVQRPKPVAAGLRAQVRTESGWCDQDWVCLLVARNPLRKGLPTILTALNSLPPRYKLLVVGGRLLAQDFLHKANDSALSDRVRLIETTSEVGRYYTAADCYVHPTLNDSFGMAPLEAMSFGLPVILSPAPYCGFAQYVKPGQEALVLSHPEDAAQLACFIEQIADDRAVRETLVQGGCRVVDRHSWVEVAQRYLELYRQVLAERTEAKFKSSP
ncbi:MAG: glycosyltransferase family 4 protein [Paralcaligenes sp.]